MRGGSFVGVFLISRNTYVLEAFWSYGDVYEMFQWRHVIGLVC